MEEEEAQANNAPVRFTEDEGEKKQFKVKSPPPDWAFNALLIKIDKGMTEKELEEIKTLFKGQEGIGGGVLEDVRRPLEFFDVLRKRTFLDRYNMLYLQAMLLHIERRDLIDLTVAHAESCGDIVHFKSPPAEPANGYAFVQFHVAGTDSYTKDSLEELRTIVATILCVEPRRVTIAGIEPSASLLITLMIPKRCTQNLATELKLESTIKQLTNLGIDRVKINEFTILLKEVKSIATGPLVQQNQLVDMYKKLRTTEEQLEERELECLKLSQQLRQEVSKTTDISNRMVAVLMGTMFRAYTNVQIPKLSRQSALVYLQYWFRRLEQQNITKETREVILNLLDAKGLAVTTRIQEAQTISLQDFQVAMLELAIALDRGQLGLFGTIQSELEKHQQETQKQKLINVQRTTSVQFDEYTHRVLEEISDLLTEEERQQLINKYAWPENENLTSHIHNRDRPLLACLICKESEQAGSAVDAGPFVIKLLKDVKREDLVQKFITQPPSKELNQIQHQLNLVLEKLDAIQTRTNTENNPSINFAPSLNVNALKLDYGSEIFRKLMLDQTNVKEMPFMQHMI